MPPALIFLNTGVRPGRAPTGHRQSAFAIIDGHPDPDRARFVHALTDADAEGAEAAGQSVDFPLLRTKLDWYRHLVTWRDVVAEGKVRDRQQQ